MTNDKKPKNNVLDSGKQFYQGMPREGQMVYAGLFVLGLIMSYFFARMGLFGMVLILGLYVLVGLWHLGMVGATAANEAAGGRFKNMKNIGSNAKWAFGAVWGATGLMMAVDVVTLFFSGWLPGEAHTHLAFNWLTPLVVAALPTWLLDYNRNREVAAQQARQGHVTDSTGQAVGGSSLTAQRDYSSAQRPQDVPAPSVVVSAARPADLEPAPRPATSTTPPSVPTKPPRAE